MGTRIKPFSPPVPHHLHATTKVPPAELLFNRVVNGKLPTLEKKNVVDRHKEAKENEQSRKIYNKSYADKRKFAKRSDVTIGDCVLVKQEKQNKLTPRSLCHAEDSNKRRITRTWLPYYNNNCSSSRPCSNKCNSKIKFYLS